jgi:hypothetical protein
MKTSKSLARRSHGWFAALLSDPYRKLAAVALAIGLWFFLDSQITRDLDRILRLETTGAVQMATTAGSRLAVQLPTDRVIGLRFLADERPVESVQIRLSGPRYRIDALVDETLDLQVTRFLGAVDWANRKRVEFTVADVQRNSKLLQGVRLTMTPPRLVLEVEKIDDRALQLGLDLVDLQVDEQLESRLRLETTVFLPEVARLLGPASSLAQFPAKGQKPLRARLRGRGNDRLITASLELNAPAELGLSLAERLSLTIQVRPITQVYEFDLQVHVDDLALPPEQRNQYRPTLPVVRTRIRAGGLLHAQLVSMVESKRAQWAYEYLRLGVFIPPPEAGAPHGVDLVRDARLFLRGHLHPMVERAECELDQTVSVTLRRQP